MANGVFFTRATNGSASDNDATVRRKFTWSAWCKLGSNWDAAYYGGFFAAAVDGSNHTSLKRDGNEFLNFQVNQGGSQYTLVSDLKIRDYSAWYHIMIVYDSTLATQADRAIMYINGVRSTTSSAWNGTQNLSADFGNTSATSRIGMYNNNTGNSYGYTGYMSEVVLTIGYALSPTAFGSTDTTTGEWKPNSGPSGVTYSPNGYYLKFTNAGALGTDSSGNGNTYSITNNSGSVVQTVDTPQNNFCTLNPLPNYYAQGTISQGSLKLASGGAAYTYNTSSVGVANGKWYMEVKIGSGSNTWWGVGIAEGESSNGSGVLGRDTYYPAGNEYGQIGWFGYGTDFVYQNNGYYSGSTNDYNTSAYTTGDILSIALDADSNKVYFYKNGAVQNSGTGFNIGASSTGFWHYAFGDYEGGNSTTHVFELNFGNPQFTISSNSGNGYADANAHGKFQYTVPSGYYALCTKNLQQYG